MQQKTDGIGRPHYSQLNSHKITNLLTSNPITGEKQAASTLFSKMKYNISFNKLSSKLLKIYSLFSISVTILSLNSSRGTAPRSPSRRSRTETVLSSISLSPTINI